MSGSNEMDRRVRSFMCGVDWQYHLDADALGTTLYPDEESLRDRRKCIDECGIVEVEVRLIRWVRPQNLFGRATEASTASPSANPEQIPSRPSPP